MNTANVLAQLKGMGSPERAKNSMRFFKTGPGQYGEGDQFLGITVPEQRKVAKQHQQLPLGQVIKLLQSPYHEARLTALFILVTQYRKGTPTDQQNIYQAYLANTAYINNWDLVDSSAEFIVGPQLGDNYQAILTKLATSKDLWERRIAMLACFHTIKACNPKPAFEIIELFKDDQHDLLQKAVGWMLREIGKRCGRPVLQAWLLKDKQYTKLPRTTLRYAIEHYSPMERKKFLAGTF